MDSGPAAFSSDKSRRTLSRQHAESSHGMSFLDNIASIHHAHKESQCEKLTSHQKHLLMSFGIYSLISDRLCNRVTSRTILPNPISYASL